MAGRGWLFSTTSLCTALMAFGLPALAADADAFSVAHEGLPAVSEVNGKFAAFGGGVSGESLFGVVGALSVPLGHSFGVQFDGMAGSARGAAFYGGAAHLFWRDPARGLVGLYGSYLNWSASTTVGVSSPVGGVADITGADGGKLGLEAEAYLDRLSLEGMLAWQYGTVSGVAGKATLAFYPTDNLRLEAGYRHLAGVGSIGTVGAEWAPGASGFSLFANGGFGGSNYWYAHGGVKVYFGGEQKPLIRRHREDDPDPDLPEDLFTTTGSSYCPDGFPPDDGFCDGII